MLKDRLIAGLGAIRVTLSPEQVTRELDFLHELLRWTRQINLTSVRDPIEALEKHLLDALALLPYLSRPASLLDMGSGAGLPGIPLAIAAQRLQVVSVDSVGKKINFQKHVKRLLAINNLTPLQCRLDLLETNHPIEQRFDFVTARAFSSLNEILPLAKRWLNNTGCLLAMKGPEGAQELRELSRGACYGFEAPNVDHYQLPFSKAQRVIIKLQRSSADDS